jgi:hypothetical protein
MVGRKAGSCWEINVIATSKQGNSSIVYLDQNKWIELAMAISRPDENMGVQTLVSKIYANVGNGSLILPLTSTNIYETQKVNDPIRRRGLAYIQALLSRGMVIRGRHKRMVIELTTVLASCCNLPHPPHAHHWFLSDIFFEAFSEWKDDRLEAQISENLVNFIRTKPSEMLFDYLAELPEETRKSAVINFSDGSERLRSQVEDRRAKHACESRAMRSKIYSALIMIDNCDRVIRVANSLGVSWKEVGDIGSVNARRITNEVPIYYIEREIALRLEAQKRPIHENDFRDMQSFCAVIPYVDIIIGEKQFVNLARQAGLGKKYKTQLETDFSALDEFLLQPN